MATSWISCSACSTSDPSQDTVKIDPKRLSKENVQPLQSAAERDAVKASEDHWQRGQARQRKDEAIAAAAAADAARQHEEAEKRKAEVEKAHREEGARRKADAAREEDAARAAAAAAKAAQEERQRQEIAEAQARLESKDAQEKVNKWCRDHGFKDMNTSKKTYMGGVKFPFHTAVKHSNQEIISMMLLMGVQRDAMDSKSRTPSQLAAKLNKNGSHMEILTMLL